MIESMLFFRRPKRSMTTRILAPNYHPVRTVFKEHPHKSPHSREELGFLTE